MKTVLCVAVSLAFLLPPRAAFAQDGHSHSHSHGSSSDRQYSEDEIRSRLERIDGCLRQIDRNGNGMLDADEATGDQRRMVEYLFERAGMPVTVPFSIAQLRQGAENYYRGRSSSMPSMAAGCHCGYKEAKHCLHRPLQLWSLHPDGPLPAKAC